MWHVRPPPTLKPNPVKFRPQLHTSKRSRRVAGTTVSCSCSGKVASTVAVDSEGACISGAATASKSRARLECFQVSPRGSDISSRFATAWPALELELERTSSLREAARATARDSSCLALARPRGEIIYRLVPVLESTPRGEEGGALATGHCSNSPTKSSAASATAEQNTCEIRMRSQ